MSRWLVQHSPRMCSVVCGQRCFSPDEALLSKPLPLRISDALPRSATHLPAPPGSRNCYGQWPAPMEVSRCSSRSLACPHTGRSYSWPGSHTRSHLQGGQRFIQNLGIIPSPLTSYPLPQHPSRTPHLVSALTHLLP